MLAVALGLLVVSLTPRVAKAGSLPALLAFQSTSGGLYIQPVGSPTQQTLVSAAGYHPEFSPNGTELAYLLQRRRSNGTSTNTIVVGNRTGGAPHDLLAGSAALDGSPNSVLAPLAWSPNGKELAYGCDGDQSTVSEQVCVVDVATGAHRLLTDPATNPFPAEDQGGEPGRWSWAPDGKDIVIAAFQTGPCKPIAQAGPCEMTAIGDVDVHTGTTTLLTQGSDSAFQSGPAISPDGRQIIFDEDGFNAGLSPSGLQIMNADGAHQRDFDPAGATGATWGLFSPNGKDVLFNCYTHVDLSVIQACAIPVGGGKVQDMTDGHHSVSPNVSWTGILTTCTVPHLVGRTVRWARRALRAAACALGRIKGPVSGRITAQSVPPGRNRPAGTRINVHTRP